MARPTLATHPKFAKLAYRLGSRALARGVLELIWESCYAAGDPIVGDADAVEALADWRGERGVLVAALIECRLLDPVEQMEANEIQVLAVHDLEDHAPNYVLKRWEREAKRRESGETIRSLRQDAARQMWAKRHANGKQLHANGTNGSASVPPPAPALDQKEREPAPAIPVPPATTPVPRSFHPAAAATFAFKRVYDLYPSKNGKQPAAAEFQRLAEEHPGGEEALADEICAAMKPQLKNLPYCNGSQFCPNLAKYLAERRWLDPLTKPDARGSPRTSGPPPIDYDKLR